ncbi:MAG: hypothetical protein HY881_07460 [Deltaproteobacteria bacterium]|nr:hypothetical protein [Deltaproteobacteria bacterium]
MTDYYEIRARDYHDKTFAADPSIFFIPLYSVSPLSAANPGYRLWFGSLVHIPHERFLLAIQKILSCFSSPCVLLVTMKEGGG